MKLMIVVAIAATIAAACGQRNPVQPTVIPASGPTAISLSVTPPAPLFVGDAASAMASATIVNGSQNSISDVTSQATWQSSNPAVATVAADGKVTALASGTTMLEARYQAVRGTAVLTVYRVTGVTLSGCTLFGRYSPVPSPVLVGQFVDCPATVVIEPQPQGFTPTLTWSSSNPSVATIDEPFPFYGHIAAISPGEAEIAATFHGVRAAISIHVAVATQDSVELEILDSDNQPVIPGYPYPITVSMGVFYAVASGGSGELTGRVFDHQTGTWPASPGCAPGRGCGPLTTTVSQGSNYIVLRASVMVPAGATEWCAGPSLVVGGKTLNARPWCFNVDSR